MSAYKDEQFDKWVDMWDKTQHLFDKDDKQKAKPKPAPEASFFGMNSFQDEEVLDEINESDLNEWRDVMERTKSLYGPINEAKKSEKSDKKPKTIPSKKKKGKRDTEPTGNSKDDESLSGDADEDYEGMDAVFKKTKDGVEVTIAPNPIHFASPGKDSKMRVTPNWTAGSVLAAVAKIKSMMYDMECEMLTAEALGGNVKTLQDKLNALNKQFHAMSEMLTPDPKTDFS